MLCIIEGLAGGGKTFFQTKILYNEWKHNQKIAANYRLLFSDKNEDISRYHQIEELYHLRNGVIGIDEAQDLAGHWVSIPISFREKIAHHRHHGIDIYANTQSFMDLHVEIRRNTHEIYRCQSLLRFPIKDSTKPIFQILKITKRLRQLGTAEESIKFRRVGRPKYYFLSKFWTKKRYDTFANIDFDKYIIKVICEKKTKKHPVWIVKLYNRDMVQHGQARL
jgi:hypothetical protein